MNFDFYSFMFGAGATILTSFLIFSVVYGISWLASEEDRLMYPELEYTYPLRWWVDDLSHRVCALTNHPDYGLHKLPWPDNEKVYIAIDESYHNQALGWWYAEACSSMDKGVDIRKENFPDLLEKMKQDLKK